jgi:hypothetical protein
VAHSAGSRDDGHRKNFHELMVTIEMVFGGDELCSRGPQLQQVGVGCAAFTPDEDPEAET